MAIEFLALPEEQLPWLKNILAQEGTWCWIRLRGPGSRIVTDPGAFDDVDFQTEDLMELDFGRYAVQEPVFKETGYGIDLDFPRSLVAQFIPSLILERRKLFVGQIGISSKSWYDFYGVDSDPIFAWYRELSRSWKKLFRDDSMVVVHLDTGQVSPSRWVHLSSGAIDWWKRGNELKNSTNLTFKYDVVPRTPRSRRKRKGS
jgi:hypothetical protein